MELILFPYCPYGHRARITLLKNKLPHKVTYLDPDNMPEDFTDISPLGKVPVLCVPGNDAVFESAVINELIDQLGDNNLLPDNPVKRARARAWIEFGSSCQMEFGSMLRAVNEQEFLQANDQLISNLQHVEREISDQGSYFLGENFSLVDSTYAPLLARLELLNEMIDCFPKDKLPRVAAWSAVLGSMAEVSASVDNDLPGMFSELVTHLCVDGYVATQMALKAA